VLSAKEGGADPQRCSCDCDLVRVYEKVLRVQDAVWQKSSRLDGCPVATPSMGGHECDDHCVENRRRVKFVVAARVLRWRTDLCARFRCDRSGYLARNEADLLKAVNTPYFFMMGVHTNSGPLERSWLMSFRAMPIVDCGTIQFVLDQPDTVLTEEWVTATMARVSPPIHQLNTPNLMADVHRRAWRLRCEYVNKVVQGVMEIMCPLADEDEPVLLPRQLATIVAQYANEDGIADGIIQALPEIYGAKRRKVPSQKHVAT
jgi:hypothetical protein